MPQSCIIIAKEDDAMKDKLNPVVSQEFSHSALVEDGQPEIMPVNSDKSLIPDMTDDEKIDIVAAQILKRFKPAFEELAK